MILHFGKNFNVSVIGKLASAYIKCLKLFFGFSKYSSVTAMLLQLCVPSFNAVYCIMQD